MDTERTFRFPRQPQPGAGAATEAGGGPGAGAAVPEGATVDEDDAAAGEAGGAGTAAEPELPPGAHLGPYRILGPLGTGGMGTVYLAHDPRLARDVAIKVLARHTQEDPIHLRRFEREARAAGSLNHPNLLAVYDVGDQDGIPYVVTELLEGETLAERLWRGPLAPAEALACARQLAEGLAAAHAKGIVHRDLKPANVFLTRDGRVKILDFGLAKRTALADAAGAAAGATRPGLVVGTASYMSPEQVRGQPVDPRSDLFAFGAVLYEMLSGQRAFAGPSAVETMSGILTAEPPDLSRLAGAVPPAVERLVRACLRKDRDERLPSAAALAAALAELERGSPAAATAPASFPAPSPSLPPPGEPRPAAGRRRAMATLAGLAALAALAAAAPWLWRLRPGAGARTGRVMLAVLPVRNLTGDPRQEYISDGLTEELISQLGGLNARQLGVIARASAMSYKGTHKTADQIGRELGVDYLLESSLRGTGDRIRATAQLVRTHDQTEVWSQTYDRTMSDVVAMQTDIARAIAGKIQVQLAAPAAAPGARARRVNPDAYLAYLQGRYHWNKRSREMLLRSLDDFRQAIALDPDYAQAQAGLADSYLSLVLIAEPRPEQLLARARTAALAALRLDERLAEAHTSLAYAKFYYDWDWPGAEAEFRRAISLNPGYATAHQWYAEFLGLMGREPEAVAEGQQALALDPLSLIINMEAGLPYLYSGQYDLAIAHFRKTLQLDPGFALAHCNLGGAYVERGEPARGIPEIEEALRLDRTAAILSFLGHAYATAGRRADAERVLAELARQVAAGQVSAYFLVRIDVALHQDGQALDALERAYDEHHWGLVRIAVVRVLDPLRDQPRFVRLLRRMRFPPRRLLPPRHNAH
jgi:eukaryotic-like serine/threonine-protein kinase